MGQDHDVNETRISPILTVTFLHHIFVGENKNKPQSMSRVMMSD